MRNPASDFFLWLPNLVVGWLEGENDGLLTPESVAWGDFRGVIRGAGRRGVSHCDEIDLRRRPLCKKAGNGLHDIVAFYQAVVTELAEGGF